MTLVSAPAEAEATTAIPVELDWRGPAGCPDARHVEATIARLVGRSMSDEDPLTHVRARVRSQGEGFVVDLRARTMNAEDHRTIRASRCAVLADATALIVAVALRPLETTRALDSTFSEPISAEPATPWPEAPAVPPAPAPDAPGAEQPSAPEPARTPGPSASEPPPAGIEPLGGNAPAEAERQEPSRRPLRVGLSATAGPGFNVLPGVAAELRGSVALLGRAWRVEASAMHWFSRTTRVTSAQQPSVQVALTGGGIRGCYVLGRDSLQIPMCTGLEAGAMLGRGRGATVLPRASRSLWLAAPVGPGLLWAPRPRVALRLGIDAILALIRPGFDILEAGIRTELFRAAPIGGRASLGIELRLP